MIVYTIVSPVMGWLGDRYNRKILLAGGVGLWSLATVGTAFSADFYHMFFWRALLGVGEASYGVIAPTLWSDLFPVKERGRAMGVYYLALAGRHGAWDTSWVVRSPMPWGGGPCSSSSVSRGSWPRLRAWFMSDPGAVVRGGSARRQGKSSEPGRISRIVPHEDFSVQHGRHGGRDLRDRCLRGLGVDVLPAQFTLSATDAGKWIGRLLVGAGLIGIVLGMFLPDLLSEAHQAGLSAARRRRRAGRHPAGRDRHPRPANTRRRWGSCSLRRS